MNVFAELNRSVLSKVVARERFAVASTGVGGDLNWSLEGESLRLRHTAPGPVEGVSIAVSVEIDGWSREGFLMIPGAAYDGNRFRVEPCGYPPMYAQARPEETAPVATSIPSLAPDGLHLLAGGASTPALCAWLPLAREAVFVMAPAFWGPHECGLHAEETHRTLTLRVDVPGLRPHRYRMCDAHAESPDRGADLQAGEALDLSIRIVRRPCASMPEFYRLFAELRESILPRAAARNLRPLSESAAAVRRNLDENRWREGAYFDDPESRSIQPGWVGSGMFTLALLGEGTPLQRERATRTMDTIVRHALTPLGLYHGYLRDGVPGEDGFEAPHAKDWHLLRKSGDVALFLVRQCRELERQGRDVPPEWRAAVVRNLDAFTAMWNRDGTFGQFVNAKTGRIEVGGASGAGTVVGALAEGGRWLLSGEWLEVARLAGGAIGQTAVERGYTAGGPGEILKSPDSESCFGLLEGLTALWETTGEGRWLDLAADVACQALTWTVSYDYPFPVSSTFGRMGMQTTGTVIASAQNKHSAPGICSLSSLAVLKVARAKDDPVLLGLAADVARALPQYVSRDDRPIPTRDGRVTPHGFVNERVNMSDWELGGIGQGEVFYGSCWPETSILLTAFEMPGVVVDPSRRHVAIFDHVEILDAVYAEDAVRLTLRNPCPSEARVKLVLDPDSSQPWDEVWKAHQTVALGPGETRQVELGPTPEGSQRIAGGRRPPEGGAPTSTPEGSYHPEGSATPPGSNSSAPRPGVFDPRLSSGTPPGSGWARVEPPVHGDGRA